MKKILLLFFYLSLFGCKSCKDNLQSNTNSLPPVTEVGANTLGAIVNGNVWVPAGSVGGTSNFQYNFDPAYAYGTLNVLSYRRTDTISNATTYLSFSLDSLNNYQMPHTFILRQDNNLDLGYSQFPCGYDFTDSTVKGSASITVSKLDKSAGIVSGSFSAVFIKEGCDTITITDGRFDIKY